MAVRPVRDEVEAGMGDRAPLHRRSCRRPPAFHSSRKELAELVGPDGGDISDGGALPRRGDGAVRGVAAVAFSEDVLAARLVQLEQRLADANDVGHDDQAAFGGSRSTADLAPSYAIIARDRELICIREATTSALARQAPFRAAPPFRAIPRFHRGSRL